VVDIVASKMRMAWLEIHLENGPYSSLKVRRGSPIVSWALVEFKFVCGDDANLESTVLLISRIS